VRKWFSVEDVVIAVSQATKSPMDWKRPRQGASADTEAVHREHGGDDRDLYRVTKQGHACLALLGQSDQQSDEDSGDQQSAGQWQRRDDEKTESSDEAMRMISCTWQQPLMWCLLVSVHHK
jgi:hypothetical protein